MMAIVLIIDYDNSDDDDENNHFGNIGSNDGGSRAPFF